MPRNITVTFDDGSTHVYREAPDDLTPDQVSARAQQDFGKHVISLDGGRKRRQPFVMTLRKALAIWLQEPFAVLAQSVRLCFIRGIKRKICTMEIVSEGCLA